MSFEIEAACITSAGVEKENNEDNFFFVKKHLPEEHKGIKSPLRYVGDTDDPSVFAVFDGIGGAANGEKASYIASEVFSKESKKLDEFCFNGKDFLINTCTEASNAIGEGADDYMSDDMGCTVAALYFFQDEVYSCNVGDSKVYRIRAGQMVQISKDHTDKDILTSVGVDKKPVLLQYLGLPESAMKIDPYVSRGDLEEWDIYIICSDGVVDAVEPAKLYEIVKQSDKPKDIAKNTVNMVKLCEGIDDATIIAIRIGRKG